MKIQRMRIAFFTGAYNHIADGVSLTLNRLVRYLEAEGATVQVYAPTVAVPALDHAGTLVSVPSVSAPGRPEYRVSLGLTRRIRKNLTQFQPHLFHIATPDLPGLGALRLSAKMGVPAVASYHTHFASYLDYYRLGRLENSAWRYLRWFYSRCREVYVPSESMRAVLAQHGIDRNLRLWPRGVDSTLFSPSKRSLEWRRGRGIADDDVAIAFISRLVTEKGLAVVVDVLNGLTAKGIRHKALFVGEGPERAMLEAALPDAVFEGHLTGEDLARAYASSDVFLFPSETETFGNVTLEALSSGLPVVAANATGSNSLVIDGATGYLAPPRHASAFLSRVEQLVSDNKMRARMSRSARESAAPYEWSRVLAQMAAYYEALLT
jgi:glycosyltransferase involved in cell wall biosynthesis